MKHLSTRWKGRLPAAAGAATLMAALALPVVPALAGPPASAAPAVPGGFASWRDLYAYQDRLDLAAQRIAAVDGHDTASIVANPADHLLRVYWPGDVPAPVRNLAGTLDVPVTFLPAAYSHRDLAAEAQRLATGGQVIQAAPESDGGGLAVTVAAGQLQPNAEAGLRAATTLPLTITAGERPRAVTGRQADTPFFWGGSRYFTTTGGCTNGFPLKVPRENDLTMISAGHCGNNGDAANVPGQGTPTGTVMNKNGCRDTLTIRYSAGVFPEIFTGAFNASSGASVVGATPDFVGNLIVTGGASSGEHQNIPVRAVDVFTNITGLPCATTGPLTVAGYSTPTCAAAPGDSGGPAYSYTAGGNVQARGTITATDLNTVDCPGVSARGGEFVWYAPLVRPAGDAQIGSLAFYGLDVLTCPTCVPAPVAVPDLTGDSVDGAASDLGAVGLHIGQIGSRTDFSCNNIGTVLGQTPAAGTVVEHGSAVNITLGDMPPPPFECP